MPERLSIPTLSTITRCGLALLGGVLACVAIALAMSDPELTYSTDVIDESRDIQVTCTSNTNDGTSDIAQAPLLDDGEHLRGRYEVTRGEDVLDGVISDADDENTLSAMVQRGINADCAAARTNRTSTAVWVLGGGLLAALAALVAPLVLGRRQHVSDGARV